MNYCVNRNTPEFVELLNSTKLNPIILAAKISLWQEKNNTDIFPTIYDLNLLDEELLEKPSGISIGAGTLAIKDIFYDLNINGNRFKSESLIEKENKILLNESYEYVKTIHDLNTSSNNLIRDVDVILIIKPLGLELGKHQLVLDFIKNNADIISEEDVYVDSYKISQHYKQFKNESFFSDLVEYYTGKKVKVFRLKVNESSISEFRKKIGHSSDFVSDKTTLRYQLVGDKFFEIKDKFGVIDNGIHFSDSKKEGLRETEIWFGIPKIYTDNIHAIEAHKYLWAKLKEVDKSVTFSGGTLDGTEIKSKPTDLDYRIMSDDLEETLINLLKIIPDAVLDKTGVDETSNQKYYKLEFEFQGGKADIAIVPKNGYLGRVSGNHLAALMSDMWKIKVSLEKEKYYQLYNKAKETYGKDSKEALQAKSDYEIIKDKFRKQVYEWFGTSKISRTLSEQYEVAKIGNVEFNNFMDIISHNFPQELVKVVKAPLKSENSLLLKAANKFRGRIYKAQDIVRGTLVISDELKEENLNYIFSLLKQFFPTFTVSDYFKYPKQGYRGMNISILTNDDGVIELQINTPSMIYLKETKNISKILLGDELFKKIDDLFEGKGGIGHNIYDAIKIAILNKNTKRVDELKQISIYYYSQLDSIENLTDDQLKQLEIGKQLYLDYIQSPDSIDMQSLKLDTDKQEDLIDMHNINKALLDRGVTDTTAILTEDDNTATFLLYNLMGQITGRQRYNSLGVKSPKSREEPIRYIIKNLEGTNKIFGLHTYNPNNPILFITEGVFDAIMLHQQGLPAIAVLTATPDRDLINQVNLLNGLKIVIADNDKTNTGLKLKKIADELIITPIEKDLNDLYLNNPQEFKKFIKQIKYKYGITKDYYTPLKNENNKPKYYLTNAESKKINITIPEQSVQTVDLPINADLIALVTPVLNELNTNGYEPLIVGGAVRDALLGIKPKDIDIEVYNISLEELEQILLKYGRVDAVGKAFGILKFKPFIEGTAETVEMDEPFDFSVPRRENKVGLGYKGFETEFDLSITKEEAATRRDFTWNSLGYNPITKTLYDYYNGIHDLKEGIIKHTSDKFVEDPLRILRSMQFQARMGHNIAPETFELIRSIVNDTDEFDHLASNELYNEFLKEKVRLNAAYNKHIKDGKPIDEFEELDAHNYYQSMITRERLKEEWIKWATKGKYHSKIFDFLRQSGLGQKLYPELLELESTQQDIIYHPEGNVEEHTMQVLAKANEIALRENLNVENKQILILSALLHDIAKPETTKEEWSDKLNRMKITAKGHEPMGEPKSLAILKRIDIQESIAIQVGALIREHLAHATISSLDNEKGKRSAFAKLINRLKPANVEMLMLLMEADMLGRNNANQETPISILEFQRLLEDYKERNAGKLEFIPILTGKHLIAKGVKPGKSLGEVLNKAKEAQLNLDFESEPEALEWLNNYLSNNENASQSTILYNATVSKNIIDEVVEYTDKTPEKIKENTELTSDNKKLFDKLELIDKELNKLSNNIINKNIKSVDIESLPTIIRQVILNPIINGTSILEKVNNFKDYYNSLDKFKKNESELYPLVKYTNRKYELKKIESLTADEFIKEFEGKVFDKSKFSVIYNKIKEFNTKQGYHNIKLIERNDGKYVVTINNEDVESIKQSLLEKRYKKDEYGLNVPWYHYAIKLVTQDLKIKYDDIFYSLKDKAPLYLLENNIDVEYTDKVKDRFIKDLNLNTSDFDTLSDLIELNDTIDNYIGLKINNQPVQFYQTDDEISTIDNGGKKIYINNPNVVINKLGIVKSNEQKNIIVTVDKNIIKERNKKTNDHYINGIFSKYNISNYLTLNEAELLKDQIERLMNKDNQSYTITFGKNGKFVKLEFSMNDDNILTEDNFSSDILNNLSHANIYISELNNDYRKLLYDSIMNNELNDDFTCSI